jgi:hypothetical protein
VDSLFFQSSLGAVLWRANKHLHKVIVQRVIKLALKAPFELGMIEVAGMQVEIVGVYGNGCVFELNNDFYAVAFAPSGKIQEGVLVELKLREHAVEARCRGFRHTGIVRQDADLKTYSYLNASIGSSLAALIAGNMPLTMPTKLKMAVDQIKVAELM